MGEVTAYADALVVRFVRRSRRAGVLVAVRQVAMNKIDDGPYPLPPRGYVSEQSPGDIGEMVCLAIPASQ